MKYLLARWFLLLQSISNALVVRHNESGPWSSWRFLCSEPAEEQSGADVEILIDEARHRRQMVFRPAGNDYSSLMLGTQSTIQCRVPGSTCSAGDTAQVCSRLDSTECRCKADVSQLPSQNYQRTMVQETLPVCTNGTGPVRILVIGAGGGVVPMYLRHNCGNHTMVESVEVDARVAAVAEHLLGFRQDERSRLEVADGLAAVRRRNAEAPSTYDLILVDCFGASGQMPSSCRSDAFVAGLQELLRPGGRVLQNVLGVITYKALNATYRAPFQGHVKQLPVPSSMGQFLLEASKAA